MESRGAASLVVSVPRPADNQPQQSMKLTAIIPRLPPLVDGVGDYARALARLLRDNASVATRFIVADSAWTGAGDIEGFEAVRMTSRSADELLELLGGAHPADRVLLHYEGYGYAMRGCPFWLVEALERWRRANDRRFLVTMFHELFAKGPPWTSSFWLSAVQKSLTARLARLSDSRLTSLECNARVLEEMSGRESSGATHIAVFSSIGEPRTIPLLQKRRRRLVVFGTRGRRIEVYRRSAANLNRICNALGIEQIIDIGRPVDFEMQEVLDVPVMTCGELPGWEVSEICLDSVAGVIDYPAAYLGKSTIFAAYCAHGMIPIVASHRETRPADGLDPNTHYWLINVQDEHLNFDQGRAVADNALEWYQGHNLSAHAKLLGTLLNKIEVEPANQGARSFRSISV